ncbi:hypothetical protein [Mesorhizobium sp. L-2-11]|uniref:hypothetical protein n=1 Tax=Mesorhizobium sp. L-2-11 TaxID=2744521 RepID=UPI001926F62A|nr:hypothetical protein [Mesorhizobium sp. L-2-11]BCH19953.1 hypothetical protein MesoLjLa_68040 [Mesorhizobium sp. L-2-11]
MMMFAVVSDIGARSPYSRRFHVSKNIELINSFEAFCYVTSNRTWRGEIVVSQSAAILKQDNSQPEKIATTIGDRLSQELVIALVGPVASGVSTTAKFLADLLSQKYGYDVGSVANFC